MDSETEGDMEAESEFSRSWKIYREFVKKPFVDEERRARLLNNVQILEAELKS